MLMRSEPDLNVSLCREHGHPSTTDLIRAGGYNLGPFILEDYGEIYFPTRRSELGARLLVANVLTETMTLPELAASIRSAGAFPPSYEDVLRVGIAHPDIQRSWATAFPHSHANGLTLALGGNPDLRVLSCFRRTSRFPAGTLVYALQSRQ